MYYDILNNQIKNVLIYLRKSREDIEYEKATGEDTLGRHRQMLTSIAKDRGYIYDLLEEVESGDTIASRPVFQKVLEQMGSGKYQAVVVTELSRLGRGDMQDAGKIIAAFRDNNLYIITPSKIYDINNSADYRQIRFELFLAKEEYELIKERLDNGKLIKANRGEKPYGPNRTYGYNQVRGKVTILPSEAEIVKKVFNMRLEGNSYKQICDYFNNLNIPTKKGTKWHNHTVSCMINNKIYIGIIEYKGKEYNGNFEPIIDIDLWNKVHLVQEQRTVNHVTHIHSPFFLNLYCGICGAKMHGDIHIHSQVKNPHKVSIYRCKGKHKYNFAKASEVHNIAFEKLKETCSSIESIKQHINFNNIPINNITNTINQLKRETKEKFKFLDRCQNDYEKGVLPAELYAEHWNKIKGEIKLLEDSIKEYEKKLSKSNVANPEYVFNFVNKVIEFWDIAENYEKREAVNLIFKRMEYANKELNIIL